jgi:hypothetical protein
VLPAAAETPTCFTIWCRFFIWSLTPDILRFYGDQVELMLLMIPVISETSPFWIYNHAHQRTQEVSNLTLLHKDSVGSCQKPKKNSSRPFHPNTAKSRNRRHCKHKESRPYVGRFPLGCWSHHTVAWPFFTKTEWVLLKKPKKNSKLPVHPNIAKSRNRRHCKDKETTPYVSRFPLGCCYHITLCVTTVASRTEEEVTCSHLHFPIEVDAGWSSTTQLDRFGVQIFLGCPANNYKRTNFFLYAWRTRVVNWFAKTERRLKAMREEAWCE